jgi:hypothetical protein
MRVRFGELEGLDVTVVSATQLSVLAPAQAGLVDVEAILPDGTRSVRRDALLYGDCTLTLSPSTDWIAPTGGTRRFTLALPPMCGWSATSSASWLTVGSPQSGAGNAVVPYTAQPNLSGEARSAAIIVGGRELAVTQAARLTFNLNGDEYEDLLVAYDSGGATRLAVAYLRSSVFVDSILHPVEPRLPAGWRAAGTGDFNGDGQMDIVVQHDEGWVGVWLMNGLTLVDGRLFSPGRLPDPRWRISAVGDVNGDASPDLIVHHQSEGWIGVWLMRGTTLIDGVLVDPARVPDTRWKIVAATDVSHDGRVDLLWQHDDGWLAAWLMDGTRRLDVAWLTPNTVPDPSWRVRGIVDANSSDGRIKLVLQPVTGGGPLLLWWMDRTSLSFSRTVSAPSDWGTWFVAAPR